MPYLFATQDQDYSDYSSGRVLYNLPGAPAFPIRLASEIFQRARNSLGLDRRLSLFDPTCGGAYHLCALGFLHGEWIRSILASDVDATILSLAQRNLNLLSPTGLDQRTAEIKRMLDQFGKESHVDALKSVQVLRQRLEKMVHPLRTRIFQANAMDRAALEKELAGEKIDLVLSDIPYGQLSSWSSFEEDGQKSENSAIWRVLHVLQPFLSQDTLVAIAADKRQKVRHESYQRTARFGIGKRHVTFLKLQ